MPQVIEIPVDMVAFAAAGNKSPIIAVNNAQRVTLIIETSASLSAGQWVLKAALTPDTSIPGAIIATANFPATPARVSSASADLPQKYVYVEQITPPTGGTVTKISVLIE
jgi:hypothetical protein